MAHAQARRFGAVVRTITRGHAVLYKRTKGRFGRKTFSGRPVLVLTTRGAKSGAPRSVPLVYMEDGERYIVVPSNSGREEAPGWWRNLQATPAAEVQIGDRRQEVAARALDGPEREDLWDRAMSFNPNWDQCQETTSREVPLVALEPASSG